MASLNLDPSTILLSGKVAIITGGSAGIGLAASKLFASKGAHVVIADLQPPPTPITSSIFAKCDVTVWADILSAFHTAVSKFGRVDILVANAGVSELEDIFADEYDDEGRLKQPRYKTVDINLKGVMNCVKVAVSHFRRQGGGGRIVMTTSTAGYMSEPGVPIYSATKHGVVGFMRACKRVLAKDEISINCVAPWLTDTALIFPGLRKLLNENGIPVQPAQAVALAYAYSASQEDWTGRTLYVSAGTYTELEEPILKFEHQWLGVENASQFRKGQELDYLTATNYV